MQRQFPVLRPQPSGSWRGAQGGSWKITLSAENVRPKTDCRSVVGEGSMRIRDEDYELSFETPDCLGYKFRQPVESCEIDFHRLPRGGETFSFTFFRRSLCRLQNAGSKRSQRKAAADESAHRDVEYCRAANPGDQ